MATKSIEDLRRDLTKITAQKNGIEQQLADPNLSEEDRQELQSVLYESEKEQRSIQKNIDQLDAKQRIQTKKSNWKNERALVDQVIAANHIGYIINEDKFIYCRDFGVSQSNRQFKMINSTRITRLLNKMTNTVIQGRDHNEIIDYFQETGHSFLDITSSFNRLKWRESDVYNKMSVIRQSWIEPVRDGAQYHPDFDLLMHCVGGGREENIAHLEQWIAFKYLNPNRNANTPNLDLGGNPGGNGKGTMITMLKTIFTTTCVVQAHREELDKFNANWEMAVVLYYDEPEEKELAAGKLKQATGAEDMRIEKKGVDAIMADRNYNFVFMSNNDMGVVRLSGGSDGGEDRRYSVINTSLVLLDMYMQAGLDRVEAHERMNYLVQTLVKDPQEVGRWLAAKIDQYQIQDMPQLSALHGADYSSRFEDQKDSMTEAFDRLIPEFERQGIMPLSVLTDLVQAYTGTMKTDTRRISRSWRQYLKRHQIEIDQHDRERYDVLWDGVVLKTPQGKIYNTRGSTQREFELKTVVGKRPSYNGIGAPAIAKDDLLI